MTPREHRIYSRRAAIVVLAAAPFLSKLATRHSFRVGDRLCEYLPLQENIGIATAIAVGVIAPAIPMYMLGRIVRNGFPRQQLLVGVVYSSLCASWYYIAAKNESLIPLTYLLTGLLLQYIAYSGTRGQPPSADPDECSHCGYNLRGLVSEGDCPECGEHYRKPRYGAAPYRSAPPRTHQQKQNRIG